MTEQQHQQSLFKWSQQPHIRAKYSCLKLLHHIPNERQCSPIQGKQLKLAGVRAGVADICLPVASGKFHGLYIELKSETGKVSYEQEWWLNELTQQGFCARVCRGWQEAANLIERYLEGKA